MTRIPVSVLTALAIITACSSTYAQSGISGQIRDITGPPVAGAKVQVVSKAGANAAETTSGTAGDFTLQVLPGTYTLTIIHPSFLEYRNSVTAPANLNAIELQVRPQHSSVTVAENGGYLATSTATATKTATPLLDVPQAITVVTREQIADQLMMSIADVVRYVPGVSVHQGENNRDQLVIRGNSTSADFFVNGVRDDVQYYRDLYNLESVEVLKGPNALIFGRGGAGGVVNRVTKQAGGPVGELDLQLGSWRNKRVAGDYGQTLGKRAAYRFNAIYEDSDSFRQFVGLNRYGISPTFTFAPGPRTRLTFAYENFHDHRVADRGITSFQNRPAQVDISTFYGNPAQASTRALVNMGSFRLDQQAGRVNITNRFQAAAYDRGYVNFVPGVANSSATQVSVSAYDNATARANVFNQTDVSLNVTTGRIRHTLLTGTELGRQFTDNLRNTGYFGSATAVLVPFANPLTGPAAFRPSATDANNHLVTALAATYVQDQIQLTSWLQVVAGGRFDHFDLRYRNNRNNDNLRRVDNVVSPRLGIVLKPRAQLSLCGSYSVSFLPSSGDQFSSLTNITQQVKPERFKNLETGVKWAPKQSLTITAALYRLDRTNTRATDPNDATRIIQTGAARANGLEIGATGQLNRFWSIAGGYANQKAFVVSDTTAARAGALIALAPRHTFSLWNNFRLTSRLGAGLGLVSRSDTFAAIDNTVVLPAYLRTDAAIFWNVRENLRVQVNGENLFDRRYFANAHNNFNISPGNPRAIRIALIARFR